MSFWTWLTGGDPVAENPGDPDGFEIVGDEVENRGFPFIRPSAWDGWPAEWTTPNWDMGSRFNELVDIAWACLDLNARVLASMPVYRTQNAQIISPMTWMENPDPTIYSSWSEFAHQLFWDYQLGEAFILSMTEFASGYPMNFRVIPPWMIEVEIRGGGRTYRLGGPGGQDVTDRILHIRYKSTTDGAHGVGPLEQAGGRMLTAGILAKYVREVVSTGGVALQTLETEQTLTNEDAQDLLNQWVVSRAQNLGHPPVLDSGVKLQDHKAVSPADLAMIEISQFTEGRIVDLLGVPRSFFGLPTGGSLTYTNPDNWFDHHDRTTLRPAAARVMPALSFWALPRGQAAELNRDEYSRPAFSERADALVKLVEARIMTTEEARLSERLTGEAPTAALTGATTTGVEE